MSEWTWETGTPKERGEFIRSHRWIGLSSAQVRDLFGLSEPEIAAILKGADWSQESARPASAAASSPGDDMNPTIRQETTDG